MEKKTKKELMEEIEAKEAELKEARETLAKLDQYKQYDEFADQLGAMHTSFRKAGFSDEQAYELMRDVLYISVGMTKPASSNSSFEQLMKIKRALKK